MSDFKFNLSDLPPHATEFQRTIHEAAKARGEFIEQNRKELIEAWIAKHGFDPDACQMCHQAMANGEFRFWIQPKTIEPLKQKQPIWIVVGSSEKRTEELGYFTDEHLADLIAETQGGIVIRLENNFIGERA